MGKLKIYRDNSADFTVVSNRFIDEYMKDANDAQIKVYLYLTRIISANMPTSISDMADKFNHTEKDILRALKYWEKQKLLSLDYDGAKSLSGICILDVDNLPEADIVPLAPVIPAPSAAEKTVPEKDVRTIPEKPSYSLDQLRAFKENSETEQLLFIVEQYMGKTLSPGEIKTILFIYDKLGFSVDLIDYLVQYCVGKDKKDFRYIEKVALGWAENNVTTPRQAKTLSAKYDKTVYAVMKALGKSSVPTAREVTFITRWTKELGFTMDIINEACERTVMATDKHRFEYADSILTSWNRSNVHHIADIKAADEAYQKERGSASKSAPGTSRNQFNQFQQRDYDYDALEKELLSN